MQKIFSLAAVRILLLFVVVFFAISFVPYEGNFPYKEILAPYNLSQYISPWASFDGVHYINIAREGYHTYDQAFFPLYILLIRYLSPLFFGNHFMTAFLLSNIAFIVGLVYLYKLLLPILKKSKTMSFVLLLLAFPTAFFFSAVYTEGIFFLLTVLSLYFLKKKKYFYAASFAVLSSLTRLQGIFLLLPFMLHFYSFEKGLIESAKLLTKKQILFITSPFIGLIMYMIYLQITVGDPLFFFTSQPAFGANRSTSIILLPQVYYRYFKIFFTADLSLAYFVAMMEFVMFTFAFGMSLYHGWVSWIKKKSFEFSIALMSLAHIILPTLTGTFSSMTRYTLFAWSIFFILSNMKGPIRVLFVAIFILFQIVLLSLFTQGYFIG